MREVVYDSSYVLDITDRRHATPNWFCYKSPDWSNEEELRLVPKKVGGPVLRFNRVLLKRCHPRQRHACPGVARVLEWGNAREPPVAVVTTRWDPVRLHLVIDSDGGSPPETPPLAES